MVLLIIAKHANVKTTEIDFDKHIIQINDALDSTASLRELVRAFFIIVAYELNLNAEFPNSKKKLILMILQWLI